MERPSMEPDIKDHRPVSVRASSPVQSEENGSDVTIKAGDWTRKCHWSVLRTSPFFAAVRRNDCIERRRGLIEFKACTQPFLDQALQFLHGRPITITEDNVWGLLYIAEYLQITVLIEICTKWLRNVPVTLDSCMTLTSLADIYGIDLPGVTEYITGHLIELLDRDAFLRISTESLVRLLKQTRYVYKDQWMRFLERWAQQSEANAACLYTSLQRHGTTANDNVLEESRGCEADVLLKKLGDAFFRKPGDEECDVILFPKRYNSRSVCGYSIFHEGFFSINTMEDETNHDTNFNPILGAFGVSSPIVYRGNIQFPIRGVEIQNLSSGAYTETQFVDEDNALMNTINKVAFAEDTCIALAGFNISPNGDSPGDVFDGRLAMTTTIYKGKLEEGKRITNLKAVLVMLRRDIAQVAVNNQRCIALLARNNDDIFIFDEPQCHLQKLKIGKELTGFRSVIVGNSFGFVIYPQIGHVQVCVINRTQCVIPRYEVTKKCMPNVYKVICYDETCFMCIWNKPLKNLHPCYAGLDYLPADDYGRFPMFRIPEKMKASIPELFGDKLYVITLPQHALRCIYDCPHCLQKDLPNVSGHVIKRFDELNACF